MQGTPQQTTGVPTRRRIRLIGGGLLLLWAAYLISTAEFASAIVIGLIGGVVLLSHFGGVPAAGERRGSFLIGGTALILACFMLVLAVSANLSLGGALASAYLALGVAAAGIWEIRGGLRPSRAHAGASVPWPVGLVVLALVAIGAAPLVVSVV